MLVVQIVKTLGNCDNLYAAHLTLTKCMDGLFVMCYDLVIECGYADVSILATGPLAHHLQQQMSVLRLQHHHHVPITTMFNNAIIINPTATLHQLLAAIVSLLQEDIITLHHQLLCQQQQLMQCLLDVHVNMVTQDHKCTDQSSTNTTLHHTLSNSSFTQLFFFFVFPFTCNFSLFTLPPSLSVTIQSSPDVRM